MSSGRDNFCSQKEKVVEVHLEDYDAKMYSNGEQKQTNCNYMP